MAGGALALLVAGGAVVAITKPFGGSAKSSSGVSDNTYPISYRTVTRGTLTSQTEVSGTLGYAGSTSIVVPSGTATSALEQAKQQLSAAKQALSADQASQASTVQANTEALAQAEQQVATAEQTLAMDEAGSGTASQANSEAFAQAEQQVADAKKTLQQDEAALATALRGNGQADAAAEAQVASAKTTYNQDEAALSTVEQSNTEAMQQAQAQVAAAKSTLAGDLAALKGATQANSEAVAQADQQVTSARETLAEDEKALSTASQSNTEAMDQAESQLSTAKSTVATDEAQLVTDQASLSAAEAKESADCKGSGAASPHTTSASGGSSACATDESQVTTDQSAVRSDQAKVTSDQAAVTSAEQSVASTKTSNDKSLEQAEAQYKAAKLSVSTDEANLAQDESDEAVTSQHSTYTALPGDGHVVRRGRQLFAISGTPVLLLYGDVTPARAFLPGVSPGPDVAALNANLDALGYGKGLKGNRFTAATEAAIKALQRAHGISPTGQLPLGSVLFELGAVRVTSVTPKLGGSVTAGQLVLDVTLLARQVSIALDTSDQADIAVGDKVSIVLPDNSTTPGVVSSVGTTVTNNSNGSTITVLVTPRDPAATGTLDSAPVNVWITTATASKAYIVPVDALLALSSGGYALEVVGPKGAHQLEAVTLGLFDDADGLVQVSGPGVHAGQKIVVPQL